MYRSGAPVNVVDALVAEKKLFLAGCCWAVAAYRILPKGPERSSPEPTGVVAVEIIGELAPLLSVLGHHKRHKSAATSIWTCRPIWMCVAALSVRAVSYQLLCNNCNF